MKLRATLILMISIMLTLGLAGIAGARSSYCDTATFTNGTAQPGGTETLCGLVPAAGIDVTVNFDGAEVGSAVSDQYGEYSDVGEYCVTFTVPADATVGTHLLEVWFNQGEFNCQYDYAVEAAATAPAAEVPVVAALPARLPNTGFMLFPAGGLLAGGLGMLLFRKRRR